MRGTTRIAQLSSIATTSATIMRRSRARVDLLMATRFLTRALPRLLPGVRVMADFLGAGPPAFTPVRSAASIMAAWRAHFPPAEGRASVEGFMAAASMVEEGAGDTTEHEAGAADKTTEGAAIMRGITGFALATFALLLGESGQLCLARPPSQTTFPSPEEASRALY